MSMGTGLIGQVKTHHEMDFLLLEEVSRNSTHVQYNCPYCIEKLGKEDTSGKLYYSEVKEVGYCQRCHAVVRPCIDDDVDASEVYLGRAIKAWGSNAGYSTDPAYQIYSDIFKSKSIPSLNLSSMFTELDEEAMDYLEARNPFIPPMVHKLGLMSSENGVVAPFMIRNKSYKYQIRFYDRANSKIKYYTSPGEKIPYCPSGALTNMSLGDDKTITIVEGVYDAIAAMILGYSHPFAILGSNITQIMIYLIRSLRPNKIVVFMDNTSLSWELLRHLRRELTTCESYEVVPSWGDDPEEILISKVSEDETLLIECMERVETFIGKGE